MVQDENYSENMHLMAKLNSTWIWKFFFFFFSPHYTHLPPLFAPLDYSLSSSALSFPCLCDPVPLFMWAERWELCTWLSFCPALNHLLTFMPVQHESKHRSLGVCHFQTHIHTRTGNLSTELFLSWCSLLNNRTLGHISLLPIITSSALDIRQSRHPAFFFFLF